jgi:hypothetical protein
MNLVRWHLYQLEPIIFYGYQSTPGLFPIHHIFFCIYLFLFIYLFIYLFCYFVYFVYFVYLFILYMLLFICYKFYPEFSANIFGITSRDSANANTPSLALPYT